MGAAMAVWSGRNTHWELNPVLGQMVGRTVLCAVGLGSGFQGAQRDGALHAEIAPAFALACMNM